MDFQIPKPVFPDLSQIKIPSEAEYVAEDILEAVNKYNSRLDEEYEVGVMLASFGQTVTVNITAVGSKGSKLIKFIGYLSEQGTQVELYQHVSQLNFLLISLPRENKEEPKKRIGFFNED